MRPKFRVWCKRRKNWLTSNDHSLHCSSNWMMDIFSGEIVDFACVGEKYIPDPEPIHYMDRLNAIHESPFVVQQYTGLKDMNGVEIYEGDILKHVNALGAIYYEMIWDEKNGLWKIIKDNGGNGNVGSWFDNYEIAGNIFENPELLQS